MVRIIVTTEQGDPVLLNEHVGSEHLSDGHAADQLVQRLRWATRNWCCRFLRSCADRPIC